MRKWSLLIVLGLVLAAAPIAQAQEDPMAEDMGAAAGETMKAAEVTAVEVGNTICPVTGNVIDMSKSIKFEYNGKIYNLCCPACISSFADDPEKFAKIAEESVGMAPAVTDEGMGEEAAGDTAIPTEAGMDEGTTDESMDAAVPEDEGANPEEMKGK